MDNIKRDEDFIVESGRATLRRMFIRVVHQPTGKSRMITGLDQRPYQEIVNELIAEVWNEVNDLGDTDDRNAKHGR